MKIWLVVIGVMLSYNAHAAPILDQDNFSSTSRTSSGCMALGGDCNWQQEVIAGVTGVLDSVAIEFNSSASVALDLFDGTPLQFGAGANTTTVAFSNADFSLVTFDVSALNFAVTAGSSFTIGVRLLSGGTNVGLTTGFDYAGDLGISRTSFQAECFSSCNYDIRFQTFVNSVPAPATTALLALGLLGAGFARRRVH